jgi:ribonuclease HI
MTNTSDLVVYSDGGARGNPGPAAIGVLVCDADGTVIEEFGEVIGEATNNIAEYCAVIKGLEISKKLGGVELRYFLDSELVANQLLGKYKIKTPHIRTLFEAALEKLKGFKKVTFTHVPRTHPMIGRADKLVNIALNRAGF